MTYSLPLARTRFADAETRPAESHAGASALTLREVAREDWDRISADFDGLCQEQTLAFAQSRWGRLVQRPVLFERDGQVVGGALVMIQKLPLSLAKVAITKWGPMLADESVADAQALYREMVGQLVERFSRRQGMMLSIVPRPQEDGFEYHALEQAGFFQGSSVAYPDRYIVSLRHDEDERMAGFAQKWRYHLKKAFKAGLTFEHAPAEGLDEFMALYGTMTARKQFADHSAIDTLAALMDMPEGTARPDLFFVRKDGRPVAGAVVFSAGRTATYLYGATDDDALELRAGYFIHWHIMRWLVAHTKATMYDLGGTDGFQGLHQFKRGMVGTLGHVSPIPPMMHVAHRLRPRLLGHAAFVVRDTALRRREALRLWIEARRRRGAERS